MKIILLFTLSVFLYTAGAQSVNIYVSPSGSDGNTGTIQKPFATIDRAKKEVRKQKEKPNLKNIIVHLRGGKYFLSETLHFTEADGGNQQTKVIYRGYKNEKPIISGGVILNKWVEENGVWKKPLPKEKVADESYYFRQLFKDDEEFTRLPRAALYQKINKDYYYSNGVLSAYKDKIKKWDFVTIKQMRAKDPAGLSGFTYSGNDFKLWADYKQAEVIVHHSWESSWHGIRSIDTAKNEVNFFSPSAWPVGFFGNGSEHARYRIENIRAALDEPGEWMLDKEQASLLYIPKPGDDIKTFTCIAPVLKELLIAEGINGKTITNLLFKNITFAHTSYPLGIYAHSVHQRDIKPPFTSMLINWPQLAKDIYGSWPDEGVPGYSDPQAAIHAGQAIQLKNALSCSFSECHFTAIGNYALKLGDSCKNINIQKNIFNNLGAGAILVGNGINEPQLIGYPFEAAPADITISDNHIFSNGKVHPGSVGIFLGQTHHTKVIHNEIHDLPYSGINMGWTWGKGKNYVKNNLISENHIHHVMQLLADGGAIYTLGRMIDCEISNNHIHDIISPQGSLGGGTGGIFFDEASGDALVKDNVIYRVSLSPLKYNSNSTNPKDLFIMKNYLDIQPHQKLFPNFIVEKTGIRK